MYYWTRYGLPPITSSGVDQAPKISASFFLHTCSPSLLMCNFTQVVHSTFESLIEFSLIVVLST